MFRSSADVANSAIMIERVCKSNSVDGVKSAILIDRGMKSRVSKLGGRLQQRNSDWKG